MTNNEGWKCPGCGACYAPSTPMCFQCTGLNKVIGIKELKVSIGEKSAIIPCTLEDVDENI